MAAGQDNLTAVLYGINDMRLEQRPISEPNDIQVLIQMEVVGICGSDVHYMTHGKIGPFVVEQPMVIGHEAAGTIVKCGKNVKHLQPGDRVAIEPGCPCRMCNFCKIGKYNLCPGMMFCATPPYDGNLCRFYLHDADFCFKLPCNMDFEEGALIEPLAVGVHACKRAHVKMGDLCVVFGCGPIGLVTMMAAKAMGAGKVLVTDILDMKLQKAKELGANYTIKVDPTWDDVRTAKEIQTMLKGAEPDCCFDCAGGEMIVRTALQSTAKAGKVVLVGLGKFEMNLPLTSALIKEVDIRGVFRYNNDYPTAIEMVRSGRINVKPLITHHYRLEETLQAFETAKTQKGNPVKILIHANPNWRPS
ncbi:unnamed protein product [Acanthoscelides obtectus]|uniref:Sorbitol dehydrogenase n=1 Tax=Acanthoscelides obtectus TaxID=200917 RepID=A0A9P0NXU8_ACAOB|nr:unnamed protein product [Acanthoscelides obtectus]CAK1678925.1 Sorbitol dehydrogenase [Acanthoscelides obtectus]